MSIQRGIGPECAGKPTGSKILHASAFAQQELPDLDLPSQIAVVRPEFTDDELRRLSQAMLCYLSESGIGGEWVESQKLGIPMDKPVELDLMERIDAYLALVVEPAIA